MMAAVEEARKCPDGVPKVGVVVVKKGRIIARAYRGKSSPTIHAEQCALNELQEKGIDPKNSIVYTTLEPCSILKSHNKIPCAQQLINASVSEVRIGSYDLNPMIYRQGWKALRDAGIRLKDFDSKHRHLIEEINTDFIESFKFGIGPTGGAKFDYKQNGGRFDIYAQKDKVQKFTTSWTERGADSIYAYASVPGFVALAKYAQNFNEIDDPDSLDYGAHSVGVAEGEIVVFRNEYGHTLIKVCEVHAGPTRGTSDTSLKIKFQVRVKI